MNTIVYKVFIALKHLMILPIRTLKLCCKTKKNSTPIPGINSNSSKRFPEKIKNVNIEDLLGREKIMINTAEVADYLKDEIVLVTGGGGSIGSELCRQIARFMPKKLLIFDNYENNAYDLLCELDQIFENKIDIEVIIGSIRDKNRLEQVFLKYRPSVVFHAAAHKHVPLMEDNPGEAIMNNVCGTHNVADCANRFNSSKFILISTDKAVNPTSIMGATKRIAEMIILHMADHSATVYATVRFGNVLGSNGSVIPLFKKQIDHGGPVTVTHKDITRYFMTIQEAASLVIQAGAIAKGGESFVLDMGKPIRILELAKSLITLSGLELGVDIDIRFVGLRPGEKLNEELVMTEEGVNVTKHDKIFVEKPMKADYHSLMNEIRLLDRKGTLEMEDAREFIKRIFPGFPTM